MIGQKPVFYQSIFATLLLYHKANEEALAVGYTVIKHFAHLRMLEKCRKHEPKTRVFYISQMLVVFYNSVIHSLGFFNC